MVMDLALHRGHLRLANTAAFDENTIILQWWQAVDQRCKQAD